ncbi:SDR family oxidoreductase [Nocardia arthritidis]|uniref:Epimerase n=1 Tax=Nocardia arthritidis TaxID=228602 RepID=A0A6G9YTF2_9NOCA|nr:epimerase [Nocardia arthritidis]QIS16286.1 epimerase [Nocardia arthritidis]
MADSKDIATEFFTAAAGNLHAAGQRAGVESIVAVSIIGIDGTVGGYNAAKLAHERALLEGPLPVRILRAAQFHELVELMLRWGTQGDVGYLPKQQTQLVAARTVAEALVDLATGPAPTTPDGVFPEIAGPKVETMAGAAALLAGALGAPAEVREVSDENNPDRAVYEDGRLLPGPHAVLAGPSFAEWLEATYPAE